VSRKRLSSESKNSAPKVDFQLGSPRLVDYSPPPLPPAQGERSSASLCLLARGVVRL